MHFRASQHTTTGASPALLMLGREMATGQTQDMRHNTMKEDGIQDRIRASVNRHQHQVQQYFDRKHRVTAKVIREGDWAGARRPHRGDKMASYWAHPLQVHRQLGSAKFRLMDHAGMQRA